MIAVKKICEFLIPIMNTMYYRIIDTDTKYLFDRLIPLSQTFNIRSVNIF